MTIGQRIKYTRESKRLTLDEVAKRCNTTKQTIFKYENEIVTNIPYDKIVLLSNALSVSPSYLFGWEEKENSSNEPNKQNETNTIRIAGRNGLYVERQLTDEQIDLLQRIVSQMPDFND